MSKQLIRCINHTGKRVAGQKLHGNGTMGGPDGGNLNAGTANNASYAGLLVSWKPSCTEAERDGVRQAMGLKLRERFNTEAMRASGAGPLEWLDIPANQSADQVIAALSRKPSVNYAEKNWRIQSQVYSNDTFADNLWGMSSDPAGNIDRSRVGSQADLAWQRGFTGSTTIAVGIIDEGYQFAHPDLLGNAGINQTEFYGKAGVDDDSNGYIDDIQGWDFFNKDNSVYDGITDDHGTHVAGTIGAVGNNSQGVAGVNWKTSLLSAKFLGPTGGFTSDAVLAVDYLTNLKTRASNPINIVATNNSWGGGGFSRALYDAINRANTANILFVAAAGNSGSSATSYPAGYNLPNVISVASLDSNGGLSSFSNYGSSWVHLGAPGRNIYSTLPSTLPSNTYGSYSGTSMATPHVTGTLALMKSAVPSATALELRNALLNSVTPTASLSGKTSTGGRLNTYAAILRLRADITAGTSGVKYNIVNAPAEANESTATTPSTLSISINTSGLTATTTLYWAISGNGITPSDFGDGNFSLTGSVIASPGSTIPILSNINVRADATTEDTEVLCLDVYTDPSRSAGSWITGSITRINDLSYTPGKTVWGSIAADVISGDAGPDRLAGVVQPSATTSATSAPEMGDTFLLGDSTRISTSNPYSVFYDDRNSASLGTGDYALITDFVSGVDKLQLAKNTRYVYTTDSINGNISLYWDRDGNGRLTNSGSNQDELIAILKGAFTLSAADLVFV
jgi:subtilisin family serine protease